MLKRRSHQSRERKGMPTWTWTQADTPPAPFTLNELDPAGVLPERPYSRDELHTYLVHLRQKCQTTIVGLSDEKAHQQVAFPWIGGKPMSFFELLLYNMRHVQEHA